MAFENVLVPGRYNPQCCSHVRDAWPDCSIAASVQRPFVVVGTRSAGGLVELPCQMTLERTVTTSAAQPANSVDERSRRARDLPGGWSSGPVGSGGRCPLGSCTSLGRSPSSEFKLRFFGSVLGYVWQLMRPLLLFAVLYVS